MVFGIIDWNVDPVLFHFGAIDIRYYGLLFAISFWLGYVISAKMYKAEGYPEEWVDKLFIYTIFGTVIGARLGHVMFYGWEEYSQNPIEIFKIWKGGLASHGGAIGILVALYIYNKKVSKKTYLWVLDHIVIVVALSGFFIRLGNLMNSEIYGSPCDPNLPWAFRFLRLHPDEAMVARHPSQIYESLFYLFVFGLLSFLYWKREYVKRYEGTLFGLFLVLVFGFRMFVETFKANQESFEEDMILNMGQILSIPFVLVGIVCIYYNRLKRK